MTTGPRALLHRRHQLALWRRPLWIVIAALALDVALGWFGVDCKIRAWTLGTACTVALGARCLFRPSLRDTARALDARAGTRNRLEALAACEGRTDPLAKAIAEETASHLAGSPLPLPFAWMGGLALAVVLVAVQIAAIEQTVERTDLPPVTAQTDQPVPAPFTEDLPPPPTPMPRSMLRWIEPGPAIVTTATEVVPLLAESDGAVALVNLNLRLTQAGEPRAQLSQTGAVAEGFQSVPVTLDLAPLGCEPFTFVTYHLSAERARDGVSASTPPWPDVVSPLQVIQIRPLGIDLPVTEPPDDATAANDAERLLLLTRHLKVTQISVLRGVFALAHDMPPRVEATWPGQLQAITAQTRTLWQDASALRPELEKTPATAVAAEPLQEALGHIQKAWDELARSEPAAAFEPTDRGLDRIGDVERILTALVEALRNEQAEAQAATADAPESDSPFELPRREDTPIGRLETLAREQQELADELAQDTGTEAFAQQGTIARALPQLAADPGFAPDIQAAINAAATDAAEALRHLNDRDPHAAIEPATRAAQTLQAIVAALDAAGCERATGECFEAQRALNEAAFAANESDFDVAAGAVVDARNVLQEEGLWQQQFGSTDAARQMADMIAAIDESKVIQRLNQSAQQPQPLQPQASTAVAEELTKMAQRAADARGQLQTTDARAQELARAAVELRRAQANVQRAEQEGNKAMEDLFKKAQENAQQAGTSLPLPPGESAEQKRRATDERSREPKASDIARLTANVQKLKAAQEAVVDATVALAADPLAPASSERAASIARLTAQEAEIATHMTNLLPAFETHTRDALPPARSACTALFRASGLLERSDPTAAVTPAKEGLAWIVEVERALVQAGKLKAARAPRSTASSQMGGARMGSGTSLNDWVNRDHYSAMLFDRIGHVVALLAEEQRRAARRQVLTTATPAEAPPAYRPAVADYFESLARAAGQDTGSSP